MTEKQKIRIECMSEILEELGIAATPEQIQKIVSDFTIHIEMEYEMYSHQFVGSKQECKSCASLKSELASLTKERDTYVNSVKRRRKADHVWIENGTVMYE